MPRLILLDRAVSGNCWRVRLLAGMLGVSLERVEVDILAGQNRTDAFLAINPRAGVPALIVVDRGEAMVIRDSIAILAWLAARFGPEWLARDPVERACEQEWLAVAAAEHQSAIRAARGAVLFGLRPEGFSLDRAQESARRCLAMTEARLATNPWLAAARPTVADVASFPYLSLAGDIGIDPGEFPAMRRWMDAVRALPGFRPLADPDGPGRPWPEGAAEVGALVSGRA